MIEIKKLNYGYNKKNKLYTNLSLTINQGNIVGLLGNNGAGKSTLLKLISGILLNKQKSISTLGVNPDSRYAEMMEEIFFISEEIEFEKISIKEKKTQNNKYILSSEIFDLLISFCFWVVSIKSSKKKDF